MKIWKLAGVARASRWATTSNRICKRKKGFIDTDTDDQINVAREEFTEKVVAESWVAATVSVSLHPLVIRNISEYNTFRIWKCSDLVYAGLRAESRIRVPHRQTERQRHQADEQLRAGAGPPALHQ